MSHNRDDFSGEEKFDLWSSSSDEDLDSGLGHNPRGPMKAPPILDFMVSEAKRMQSQKEPPKINRAQEVIYTFLNPKHNASETFSRVRLILNIDKSKKPGEKLIDGIVEAKLKNGEKIQLYITNPSHFLYFFRYADQLQDKSIAKKQQRPLNWKHHGFFYAQSVINNYKHINTAFLTHFEKTTLANIDSKTPLLLLDAGCGQNPMLILKAYQAAAKQCGDVRAVAFEPQLESLTICQEQAQRFMSEQRIKDSDVKFIQARSQQIEEIVRRNPGRHIVLFSSGTLTRHTIQGVFACSEILKAFSRANVQTIFTGGQTELLFNARILRKIGFEIEKELQTGEHSKSPLPIYLIRSTDDKQRLTRLGKKIAAKNTLDLMLSPDPVKCFDLAAKQLPDLMPNVKAIDLSFCELPTDANNFISGMMNTCENMTQINCMHNQPAELLRLLLASKEQRFSKLACNIRYTDDEMSLCLSAQSARNYGYDFAAHESTRSLMINHIFAKLTKCSSQRELLQQVESINPIIETLQKQPLYFDGLIIEDRSPEFLDQCIKRFQMCEQAAQEGNYFSGNQHIDVDILLHLLRKNNPDDLRKMLSALNNNPPALEALLQDQKTMDAIYQTVFDTAACETIKPLFECGLLSGEQGSPLKHIIMYHEANLTLPARLWNLALETLDANYQLIITKDQNGKPPLEYCSGMKSPAFNTMLNMYKYINDRRLERERAAQHDNTSGSPHNKNDLGGSKF